MRAIRLLLLFALFASPVVAQDTVKPPVVVVDTQKKDTATTLPPTVRDTTAASLPTEQPKDFGAALLLFLPFLIPGLQSLIIVGVSKIFPAWVNVPNLLKFVAMFVAGGLLYIVVRLVTGTMNGDLWTLLMSGFAGILSTVSGGVIFNNGANNATAKKQAHAALKAK